MQSVGLDTLGDMLEGGSWTSSCFASSSSSLLLSSMMVISLGPFAEALMGVSDKDKAEWMAL